MKNKPSKASVNFLFLYGPTGSGKTRLLQMISESLLGSQSVMRVGSEQIVADMEQSVVHRNFTDFSDRYAVVENLLIDNLWILQSRPSAAKEIGRLLRARMAHGNLTVLASDLIYEDVILALPAIGACLTENRTIHVKIGQGV